MNNYNNYYNQFRAEQGPNSPLATAYTGFLRGNLFNNLYNQYKSYQPVVLRNNSEEDMALYNVDQLTFAAHELKLYLDNYPNDANILNLFNRYREQSLMAIDNYEKKYGPINSNSPYMNSIPFSWENDSWPWEGGN